MLLKEHRVEEKQSFKRLSVYISIEYIKLQCIKKYTFSPFNFFADSFFACFFRALYMYMVISVPPPSTQAPSGASFGDPVTPASNRVIQL